MSKDFLLNESKVFCVLPWIHMMIMPPGDVYPCCVGVDSSKFGSVNDGDFSSIINNENFKTLRANMLAEKQTPFCNGCYEFEKHGSSFRQYNNEIFKQHIDEIVSNTKEDGYLENFKMRYSDIRFRNICNFKCRTCGPEYSTAWALEENKFENTKHKVFDIKTTSNVMPELLERIDDIEMFYFAGGEPLITDEHYVILEELIRKKRTNVKIRYNTNCSVLQYKNKDIFDLWKHFDSISVSASIDHIEERAEYIRSGTEWGIIDRNLKLLRDTPNVELSVNTVLSVFNYSTLDILYDYLKNIGIFHNKSWYNSITNTERPSYFSATILPKICKDMGTERLTKLMERLANDGYTSQIQLFKNAIEFANSKDDWETERASFVDEIAKKDKQRNESFVKTFPELKPMWSRIMDIDKDYLLNESKTFCMFPWVHLNVTPKGDIYPCCSNDYTKPYGNTKEMTLKQAFNSEGMKKLRLDMLNERKNDMCNFCYKHEEAGPHSFRNYSKEHFGKQFDSLVPTTQEDGTVEEFRMHYFDIRFSNICNFKCRTCGSEFSSQWGLEMNKNYDSKHPILIHADDNKGKLLDEVLEHVHHIDLAYFAGGEPLITEEHYVILEEMIRKGHTDITLRYNTNASNIKYKNHDVLDLWKHFDRIELSCSVDHYGERAELLRSGTDWGKVESNLLTFRDLDYVSFQMNTVFSIFNYLTIGEFYQYLQDKNIVRREDWYHSLYLAVHPIYYSAKSLPKSLKPLAQEKALRWADANETNNTCLPRLVRDAVNFANDGDSWGEVREKFLGHTKSLDRIRDESFWKIFPELNSLSELLE